ncbi:MAG: methyltransferase domain-containing protein [Candidatus Bathyarchaeia archaeon]
MKYCVECGSHLTWNITDAETLENAIFRLKLKIARRIGVQKGMFIVDVGCGQGGFTAAVAKTVGKGGKVLAVDVSTEYLDEFTRRLDKYRVKERVAFSQADSADLRTVIPDEAADIVVSYRFLEELKRPQDISKIVKEMARIVKKRGRVCFTELSTKAENKAEEAYIRLHKESGDSLFEPEEIAEAMKVVELKNVTVNNVRTSIWFSPDLARQDLSFAQVWFDADVEKTLGSSIGKFGMKYPALFSISGTRR